MHCITAFLLIIQLHQKDPKKQTHCWKAKFMIYSTILSYTMGEERGSLIQADILSMFISAFDSTSLSVQEWFMSIFQVPYRVKRSLEVSLGKLK